MSGEKIGLIFDEGMKIDMIKTKMCKKKGIETII
jgi:hypothetical protein